MRERSAQGVPGYDLFIDAHHPNLKGYLAVSELVATQILNLVGEQGATLRALDADCVATIFQFDDEKRYWMFVNRGRWFTRLSTWRYDSKARLDQAHAMFEAAGEVAPGRMEPQLGHAIIHYLRMEIVEARARIVIARAINPEGAESYLAEPWIQQIVDRAYN